MKNADLYISRAFVEFGPFTAAELLDFHQRGALRDIDHIRHHGKDDWIELPTWLASQKPKPAKAAVKKSAAKKAAKKAPAKKAAAKKVPRSKA